MGYLYDLIFELDKKAQKPRRRKSLYSSDPSKGLKYNKINPERSVSKRIYSFDIARTPQVVKDFDSKVNVQGKAWLANSYSSIVDYRSRKVKGNGA